MDRIERVEQIRNVGLFSHGGAGKTTLAEAMLYVSGAIKAPGRVDDGTSVMDFQPEEKKRGISISTSVASCFWKGHKVNIIDTPGDINFVSEALIATDVVDSAIVLVSALSGVKAQTEKVWRWLAERDIPRMIYINKMDLDKADYETVYEQIGSRFDQKTLRFTLPIGVGDQFRGVVDLLFMRAFIYERDGEGTFKEEDIPADLLELAEAERREIVETVAETDEALLDKYMAADTLDDDDLFPGLRSAVGSGKLSPVLCGAALENIVARKTLDAIVNFLPPPGSGRVRYAFKDDGSKVKIEPSLDAPLLGRFFKTMVDPYAGRMSIARLFSGSIEPDDEIANATREMAREKVGQICAPLGATMRPVDRLIAGDIGAMPKLKTAKTGDAFLSHDGDLCIGSLETAAPVVAMALEARAKGEEEKLSIALAKIVDEDPSLAVELDKRTGDLLVSGMGQTHIDVTIAKLKEKYHIEVDARAPKIAYREAIRKKAKGHGRLKKQSGGHGQFADCWIEIEPTSDGARFEFVNAIVGGVIPKQYIPGVEKGIKEAMRLGPLAGYPVVGVKATLYDGKFHDVDSSELAFKSAAISAFRAACEDAAPVLLEPCMELEIMAPSESVGDIMSDLAQKRARVLSIGLGGSGEVIKAVAPLAEVLTYERDIRQITSGRGEYTLGFKGYEEAPQNIAKRVIDEARSQDS